MINPRAAFTYREAAIEDIPQLQKVRNSVVENVLSDPGKVTDAMVEEYILKRGKGWVGEQNGLILGFAICDLQDESVWALFVDPAVEGSGMGKHLHRLMLTWYFSKGKQNIWLSTEPDTRAADFYRRQGWRETGKQGEEEIRFEMTREEWKIFSKPQP